MSGKSDSAEILLKIKAEMAELTKAREEVVRFRVDWDSLKKQTSAQAVEISRLNTAIKAQGVEWRRAAQDVVRARGAFGGMRNELSATDRLFGSLKGNMGALFGAGLGVGTGLAAATTAIAAIRSAITATIGEGVRFNAILEQSQLGVGAILKQFYPTRFKTFNDALKASAGVIDELKQRALESPASFEQLLTSYQSTAGAMAAANIPLEKQVNLILSMSQALAGLGIVQEQMMQETRALLTGNIDRNALAAKILGITGADITAARQKGQLYEFLTEKLAAFSEAARVGMTSITTLESNLGDARTQVAAEATEGLTEAYRELLMALTQLVQSDGFKKTLTFLASMTAGVVSNATALVEAMGGKAPNVVQRHDNESWQKFLAMSSGVDSPKAITDARNFAAGRISEAEGRARLIRANIAAGRSGLAGERGNTPRVRQLAEDEAELARVERLIAGYRAISDELERSGAAQAEKNRLQRDEDERDQIKKAMDERAARNREEALKGIEALTKQADAAYLESLTPTARVSEYNRRLNELQNRMFTDRPTATDFLGPGDTSEEAKAEAQRAAVAASMRINVEIARLKKEILAVEKGITAETERQNAEDEKNRRKALDADLDAKERALRIELDKIARERAEVESNALLTTQERRRENLRLITAERIELEKFVKVLNDQLAKAGTPEEKQLIQSRLDTAQGRLAGVLGDEGAASQDPARGLDRFRVQIREIAQEADPMFDLFDAGFNGLRNGFTNAFAEAKSFGDGIKGVFKSFALSIAEAIQQLLAMRLAMSVMGIFGMGTTGGAGGFGSLLGGLFGGSFAGGGTFLTKGKTSITVGDNPGGVELVSVIPLSGRGQTRIANPNRIAMAGGGTAIVDNMSFQRGMRSGLGASAGSGDAGAFGQPIVFNQTQTINVSTGVQETVRAEIIGLGPVFKEMAVQSTHEAIRDGRIRLF